MRKLMFRDPMTGKKSLTVTLLLWAFAVYLISVGFYLGGRGDLKIALITLFAVGIFYAGYRQKRIRLSFTGVEIEQDQGVCHDTDSNRPK